MYIMYLQPTKIINEYIENSILITAFIDRHLFIKHKNESEVYVFSNVNKDTKWY